MKKVPTVSVCVLLTAILLATLTGCGSFTATEEKEPTASSVSVPTPTPIITHTVTFDLNGGKLVSGETVQVVENGGDAVPPNVTNGRLQLSWDGIYTNVTSDITVNAQWNKTTMSTTELAEYVQARSVTVNVVTIGGSNATGSGFFIDDQGTIVTNYHVIDGATAISVEVSNGGNYKVKTIVDFSEVYDLAILKIDITGNEYLDICKDIVKTGEQVYAVGSALGTLTGSFTAGIVSSTSRFVGLIDCIQMDAAISSGNSGGPLVNVYGEVIGVNAFSYIRGENLNLAIKITTLDDLALNKNFSVNEYKEWYVTETSRSYSPYDENQYYYSIVNTYQVVTGTKCLYSYNDIDEMYYDGYYDMAEHYVYNYSVSEYDEYVKYLKEKGFVYQDYEVFQTGTSYYYINEKDGLLVDLFVSSDNELLYIWVRLED